MTITLAFDVYGTLIDTDGVVTQLRKVLEEGADDFSRAWRNKQLEYSLRRGLMRRYEEFGVCTRDALDHTCSERRVSLTDTEKNILLGVTGIFPPSGRFGPGFRLWLVPGIASMPFRMETRERWASFWRGPG